MRDPAAVSKTVHLRDVSRRTGFCDNRTRKPCQVARTGAVASSGLGTCLLTDLMPKRAIRREVALEPYSALDSGKFERSHQLGGKKLNTLPIIFERMPLFSAVGRRHIQDGFADLGNRPACAARLNWNDSLPSEHLHY